MPPKTTTDADTKDNTSKTFSFDDVAYLCAKLEASKIGLGAKDYQNMASLHGTRSEHGYQHLFRAVKARGKELVPMISGGDASPAKGSPAKVAEGSKAKGGEKTAKNGVKRGRKARTEDSPDEDDDEINSKKVKSEVDEAGQTEEPLGDDDFN